MKKLIITLLFASLTIINAQNSLKGRVYEDHGKDKHPLAGANIYWLSSTIGTTSDSKGDFKIPFASEYKYLVVSFIGFKPDTLEIKDNSFLEILLTEDAEQIGEVEVSGEKASTSHDYFAIENKSTMNEKELFKAACCNLSESFETNPSIDVSFTDAITGAKQIEMLGLSGTYTQTSLENMPYIRGLMSNIGLSFVPGTWVQAINVSKGIGSVANGYESITGQIDVDLRKSISPDETPIFLNVYGDYDQRFEGNLNYISHFNEHFSAISLFHYSTRKNKFDMNNDNFSDLPTFNTLNIAQRWQYLSMDGWESRFGFQYVSDKKEGGTYNSSLNSPRYNFGMTNNNLNLYAKMGYVFADAPYKSFGFQFSFTNYRNSSFFGKRDYSGNEKTGYFNFLYQSIINTTEHKYRIGFSFLFDQFNEKFINNTYNRIEKVPGAFAEYTYSDEDQISLIAGVRGDYHNQFGFMFTPRIHLRYSPNPDWVIRGVAGRGFRTSNIFTEYASALASSRAISINQSGSYGYGLGQEKAWNFGVSLTHYFYYDYRDASFTIDFYRTDFEQVNIANLDSSPQKVIFSTIEKGAYSNSFQAEFAFKPFENFDLKTAYRFLDVKQMIDGKYMERPFSSKHRAFINFAYTTEKEKEDDPQMFYDLTIQYSGSKRIPSTLSNPEQYQMPLNSPGFFTVNAQITRTFMPGLDLYLGVENLFGYRQENLIIDSLNPDSQFFDASMVWGPVTGAMAYAGLRFRM